MSAKSFAAHGTVDHSKDEYVRGIVHTNTVEGFYSIFKRGMKGVYQHCAEHHLHRYLAEFDFRYHFDAVLKKTAQAKHAPHDEAVDRAARGAVIRPKKR